MRRRQGTAWVKNEPSKFAFYSHVMRHVARVYAISAVEDYQKFRPRISGHVFHDRFRSHLLGNTTSAIQASDINAEDAARC